MNENNRHSINTLHQLLDDYARMFIIAEVELHNMIPYWVRQSNSIKLKTILLKYNEQVKKHIASFEDFFEEETVTYLSSSNKIMHALIASTEELCMLCENNFTRDACLLSCIQNINHYKIGSYGSAASFANSLGLTKTANLFYEFEINEKQIDDRLSQLALHEININAKRELIED
jgi:ferritin-like metal-binding protein YciE